MASTSEQKVAVAMKRAFDTGRVPRVDGETNSEYFHRLHRFVIEEARKRRVVKRKAVKTARKRNR